MSTLALDPTALGTPDELALIAVSGGQDSVALLHALLARGHRRLLVCHWDHAWRAESAATAQWVERLAHQHGLASHLGRGPGTHATEAAGRDERYTFFAAVARTHGASRVYLGHHADDQVETFLFHLLRGAGSAGLSAMSPLTSRAVGGTELLLARPLLGVWREEITAYLRAHQQEFCEDPTNAAPDFTRNRLRHEVLPLLEEVMGRPVRRALWKTAAILSAENAYFAAHPSLHQPGPELEVRTLRTLPVALQRRLIQAWLNTHQLPGIGYTEIEAIRHLLTARRPAKVNLPGGHHARRRSGRLWVEAPPRQLS